MPHHPAQFVKPFVKSHKNDIIDAEAIAEAATRPTMRFVGVKEARQVDLQMMHRIRSRLVTNRTNLICQMRSYCLEHGVAMRTGAGVFKLDIVRVIDETSNDLTERARLVLEQLHRELLDVEERIGRISTEIKNIDDFSRECLATIVDTSLSGQRVGRELDSIARVRGYPCMVVSDNVLCREDLAA